MILRVPSFEGIIEADPIANCKVRITIGGLRFVIDAVDAFDIAHTFERAAHAALAPAPPLATAPLARHYTPTAPAAGDPAYGRDVMEPPPPPPKKGRPKQRR